MLPVLRNSTGLLARASRPTTVAVCQARFNSVQASKVDDSSSSNTALDSTLYALGARLGLQSLSPSLLEQAVTDRSINESVNNVALTALGKRVVGLLATEYLYTKYPLLPSRVLSESVGAFVDHRSLKAVGRQVGLQHAVRYQPSPVDDEATRNVVAESMNAIIGAVYKEQGLDAAKKFVHGHILARDFNLRPHLAFKQPKSHLSKLMNKQGKPSPVSRLVSETGRHSRSPVFVVAVFSGEEKLGEGFGYSLKMAEHRACQDALYTHYSFEQKDFTLPSDAHKVEQYRPPLLGDTELAL